MRALRVTSIRFAVVLIVILTAVLALQWARRSEQRLGESGGDRVLTPIRLSWERFGDLGWYRAEVSFRDGSTEITWKDYTDARHVFATPYRDGSEFWHHLVLLGILTLPSTAEVRPRGLIQVHREDGFPEFHITVIYAEGKRQQQRREVVVRLASATAKDDRRYGDLVRALEGFARLPDKRRTLGPS
jgi:hypothetical protein